MWSFIIFIKFILWTLFKAWFVLVLLDIASFTWMLEHYIISLIVWIYFFELISNIIFNIISLFVYENFRTYSITSWLYPKKLFARIRAFYLRRRMYNLKPFYIPKRILLTFNRFKYQSKPRKWYQEDTPLLFKKRVLINEDPYKLWVKNERFSKLEWRERYIKWKNFYDYGIIDEDIENKNIINKNKKNEILDNKDNQFINNEMTNKKIDIINNNNNDTKKKWWKKLWK